MPLGDGVIVAVSGLWGDRPTVAKIRAIALERRNNGHVDAVIDALQQFRGLSVEVNAFVFRRVRFAIGGIVETEPNMLKWRERGR